MTWIYLTMEFSFSSAYIGGEVKQAARLQTWAIPGTVIYAAVWGLCSSGRRRGRLAPIFLAQSAPSAILERKPSG
jgi:hypothetical protein